MEKDIQEILLTEEQIKTRIAELGKELTADYAGKDPIIVGVLKGVVVFYADMIREINPLPDGFYVDFLLRRNQFHRKDGGQAGYLFGYQRSPCADSGGHL